MEILNQAFELNTPPCIHEVIANDAVVIDLDSGNYFNMTGLSGTVWELLAQGHTGTQVLTALARHEDTQAKMTLLNFLESLLDKGLLRPTEQSSDKPLPTISTPETEIELSCNTYTDMQELLGLDPIHESDEAVGWPKAKETV